MGTLVLLVLASSFPLPTLDGKPLAVTEHQTSFRLPQRFDKVRTFYVEQFKTRPAVSFRVTGTPGQRVLTLTNHDKADTWRTATLRERETETVVDVVPVLRMEQTAIEGNGRPLVEFIIGRSPDVEKAVQGIDHTEAIRH